MPDPLMDTLDEIDRKSEIGDVSSVTRSVPVSRIRQRDTLGDRRNVPIILVTEETSL